MKTNITLGKIDIALDTTNKKKVSIDVVYGGSVDSDEDEMTLIGMVHDYLLKEGFLEAKHEYCLRFDVKTKN